MGNNLIDRQAVFDAIAARLNQSGGRYTNAELNMWGLFMLMIQDLPSAQPEQRYTEEELRVFQHGISLSLLSKRSSQHWQYDEDTATEIKFLERLYEKVVADIRSEHDDSI